MSSCIFKKLTYGLNLKTNKMAGGPRPLDYVMKQEESTERLKRKLQDDQPVDIDPKKTKLNDGNAKKSKKPMTLEKIAQINKEKIACLRNANRIYVDGSDVPDPILSFEQLATSYKLPEQYLENIKAMDMNEPTPVQMQAITVILQNRNALVCAPTGSGKTLAFSLPLLHCLKSHDSRGFRAVVLAPTRELAVQIHHEMMKLATGSDLEVQFLLKSQTKEQRQKWINADIVITTPKKLVYAFKKYNQEITFNRIQYLVVDESDKLFEDGKNGFRDQLAVIYRKCQSKDIKTLLFSATFSPEVGEWCDTNLDNLIKVYIGGRNTAAKTIEQKLIYTGQESGKIMALRNIFNEGFSAPVLIFTQSKQRSEELYKELTEDKMNIEVIHSEKSIAQRDAIVKNFEVGKIWILICTEVMARGIDFKQVNLVINYDFPTSPVSYIHRIGRTGRAGNYGKAVTFFTDNDVKYLKSIVNLMREAGCEVPEYMLQIKKAPRKLLKKIKKKAPKREPISMEVAAAFKAKRAAKSTMKLGRKKLQKQPEKMNTNE